MQTFFANSTLLPYLVLRPLSHIRSNWDAMWNPAADEYLEESDSCAAILNGVVGELKKITPPLRYHDNEDRLAEYVRDKLNWQIHKVGLRWVGEDYQLILQQGSFDDVDQKELLLALSGRIKAAVDRGQLHFDDMEDSHQKMLAAVLSVIIWQRVMWIADTP